ncbi:helix-turn-helix transcriptional regulator [Aurantimonas sp. VKM B-3413]|uniref:ArsR/SmtB family transcription factor n=1 Tax=Aurantimonas sp. VKM B-3413 TaxID=2779401 RepID=UPI001E354097|nr:metalloregulator ArsR/SmtB family transcription factor [Aurantimonas sp. VKM B-3413]MCB8839914.1 metalloregulator ArsR/SmtB family transcription factor [Aurantimonas sp. VKM B-3413]
METPPRIDSEPILETADLFKRLSHPARLAIVCHLAAGERSVGELETDLGLQQPSLSQQLTDLRKAGLIAPRRQAKQVFYRLTDERVERVLNLLCNTAVPGRSPAMERRPVVPITAAVFAKVGPSAGTDGDPDRPQKAAALAEPS